MQKLTEDQKTKLNTAIDRAQDSGGCHYQRAGEPRCVIGQLAALEGVPKAGLKRWDEGGPNGAGIGVLLCAEDPPEYVNRIQHYPLWLLLNLQRMWDSGVRTYEAQEDAPVIYGDEPRRAKMREIVAEWEEKSNAQDRA